MQRFQNHNIKEFNTFHIGIIASQFIIVENSSELLDLYSEGIFNNKFFILGSGSNLLFTEDFEGTILQINLRGINKIKETDKDIFVESMAGEDWDEFIAKALDMDAYGLENLSLIPGSVGASAVQNIGAYGIEAKDFIDSVEFFHLVDGKFHTATNAELAFAYRDSIFKHELKDQAIVTKVTYKLKKTPDLNLDYADIQKAIEDISKEELTPNRLREIIINIRNTKLENPKIVGNSGSFFKNPIVPNEKVSELQKQYPELKSNYVSDTESKLSAAWLIDQCGWKGWTSDDEKYGVSRKHALVLVNYSDASGEDLLKLSENIKASVFEKFGITLEEEVIII